MRYMLDTNIVSYYLRRSSPALEERVNDALKHRAIAISVITRAELRYGQMGMTPEESYHVAKQRLHPTVDIVPNVFTLDNPR